MIGLILFAPFIIRVGTDVAYSKKKNSFFIFKWPADLIVRLVRKHLTQKIVLEK